MRKIFVLTIAAIALSSIPTPLEAHHLLPRTCIMFMAGARLSERCQLDLAATELVAYLVETKDWEYDDPSIENIQVDAGTVIRSLPDSSADIVFTLPEDREVMVVLSAIAPTGTQWLFIGTHPSKFGWVVR